MDELPTDALAFAVTHATAAAAPGSILGNTVAYPIEPAKLFDVDVDQLSWMFTAPDRLGRLQSREPIEA
jgi:hypothetical protein